MIEVEMGLENCKDELFKLSDRFNEEMGQHKEEMDMVILNIMEKMNGSNKELDDIRSNYEGKSSIG